MSNSLGEARIFLTDRTVVFSFHTSEIQGDGPGRECGQMAVRIEGARRMTWSVFHLVRPVLHFICQVDCPEDFLTFPDY